MIILFSLVGNFISSEMTSKGDKAVKEEVKEEKIEDDDENFLSSTLKSKKRTSQINGTGEAPLQAAAKIKKQELESDEDEEEETKHSIKKAPRTGEKAMAMKDKKMVKKKKLKKEEKVLKKKKATSVAAAIAKNGKKKEKKVYDLPGQKHDPPNERDPLRIFYETLYRQLPNSEMAAFWMMEWGLLQPEEAKKVYETKLKKNQQQKLSSPLEAAFVERKKQVSVKKITVSKAVSKTAMKHKAEYSSDADDDFTPIKKKN